VSLRSSTVDTRRSALHLLIVGTTDYVCQTSMNPDSERSPVSDLGMYEGKGRASESDQAVFRSGR
jgi:hypothetical protein